MAEVFLDIRCCQSPTGTSAHPRAHGVHGHHHPGQSRLAWVRYDAAFRRQAALKGDTRWLAINTTLFTLCCSVPSAKKRCELCLAECAQRGDREPELRDRMKAMEVAVLTMVKLAGGGGGIGPDTGNSQKFNSCFQQVQILVCLFNLQGGGALDHPVPAPTQPGPRAQRGPPGGPGSRSRPY